MFQSTLLVGCDRFNFIKEVSKGKDIHTSHAAGKAWEEVALSVEDNLIHELADFCLTNIIGGNAIQNSRVRRVAAGLRVKLDAFRQKFVAM